MANMERSSGWQQIQLGLKETERLIAGQSYNLAMVKARQTLECMVNTIAERHCLVEGDLADTIDQLYEGQWISKVSRTNYHRIRVIGNKAVHENDNTAYNAEQAYQLLEQEIRTFAERGASPARRTQTPKAQPQRSKSRQTGARSSAGRGSGSRSTGSRSTGSGRSASRTRTAGGRGSAGRGKRRRRRRNSPEMYIWKLLIPVLTVIFLIVLIRVLMPSGDKKAENQQTTQAETMAETVYETPFETEPETEAPEPPKEIYRVKGTKVNVRTEPSTDSRILAQLASGTEVEYVKRYNNEWTVINYEGQEAYVSSQYLEKTVEETEAPETEAEQEPAETAAEASEPETSAERRTAAGPGRQ